MPCWDGPIASTGAGSFARGQSALSCMSPGVRQGCDTLLLGARSQVQHGRYGAVAGSKEGMGPLCLCHKGTMLASESLAYSLRSVSYMQGEEVVWLRISMLVLKYIRGARALAPCSHCTPFAFLIGITYACWPMQQYQC